MSDCTLHGLVDHDIVIVYMRLIVKALSLGVKLTPEGGCELDREDLQ